MPEISVNLPLSFFGDMSIDESLSNLKNLEKIQKYSQSLEKQISQLTSALTSTANRLTEILNRDSDVLPKFVELRRLSAEINGWVQTP